MSRIRTLERGVAKEQESLGNLISEVISHLNSLNKRLELDSKNGNQTHNLHLLQENLPKAIKLFSGLA